VREREREREEREARVVMREHSRSRKKRHDGVSEWGREEERPVSVAGANEMNAE
jgi:hypothetical protein